MKLSIGTSSAVLLLVFRTPLLPEIKTKTIGLSMRDGVRLAIEVCRDDAGKQAPLGLIRKPPKTGGV